MRWLVLRFFFFKQKTAYELRISDWSSDVCSSDLHALEIGNQSLGLRDGGPHLRLINDERSGGFLLHDLVLIRFEEKRIAVGEWDVAAHRIDLVCVNSGHDRQHAVRTEIAVGIGTVEQDHMGRGVGKGDLVEE